MTTAPAGMRVLVPAGLTVIALFTSSVLVGLGRDTDPAVAGVLASAPGRAEAVRLAFAGDVHFEGEYADVPGTDGSTLGPMSDVLAAADVSMVNLESAITDRGRPAAKELEVPSDRYWFRSPAAALGVLDRSGVDIVSVANNHGADYGLTGIRDTIRADEASPVTVLGVGRNDRAAFAPHRVNVRGTDIAIHAADASPRESADDTWAAAPGSGPGIASARGNATSTLLRAVRASAAVDDLVVVYLHWGEEGNDSSTSAQETTAQALTEAGADIIVGTHAHTPLGAGMRGSAYVSYGLGNFYWYHGNQAETGVLDLTVVGDQVTADIWVPGRIPRAGGEPLPLAGTRAARAVQDWNDLRGRTDLTAGPGPVETTSRPVDPGVESLPTFASTIESVSGSVRRGMRTYDAEACPVPLTDLRHVTLTHLGFDGLAHRGELVVNADVADDVVDVFAALYADRFPIQRMLLIDEYGGDDDASMAANNSSGFSCRPVAGTDRWSDHAYGRAIDINPVQNPYVVGGSARPPAAAPFVGEERSEGATGQPGVIRDGDVARREFDRIGWEWGGLYREPDYQHFSLPDR